MLKTKVIKKNTAKELQDDLNEALKDINEENLIDIKLTAAQDYQNYETFLAVIIYKEN